MKRCTASSASQSELAKSTESTESWLQSLVQSLRNPICGEPAVADTILGLKCQKHLNKFREDMANPHTLWNVLAGRVRTKAEIEAMIHFLN